MQHLLRLIKDIGKIDKYHKYRQKLNRVKIKIKKKYPYLSGPGPGIFCVAILEQDVCLNGKVRKKGDEICFADVYLEASSI